MIFRWILERIRQRRRQRQIARMKRWRDQDFQFLRGEYVKLKSQFKESDRVHESEKAVLRDRLEATEQQSEKTSRELELAKMENQLLVNVIERDRRRVEAETAAATRKISDAMTGLLRDDGGD